MKKNIFSRSRLFMLATVLGLHPWQLLMSQSINLAPPSATGNGQFGYSVTVLTNGNFVVTDPYYDQGAVADVGAVYLYNGSTKTLISTLKGSSAGDQAGLSSVTPLANGNFVVSSTNWKSGSNAGAGAVTWVNGTTGLNGTISSANSLVGSNTYDVVGRSVYALPNGNYVVASINWKNGSNANAGAVTWGSGTAGITGVVSASNSLVGTAASNYIGGTIYILTNGNYVVSSINWSSGSNANAGAATWGSGTAGVKGVISSANSLVGTKSNDRVGYAITPLINGHYVVSCYNWGNGANTYAGAVTWGNGTTGVVGEVSASNSLIGTNSGDQISRGRVWPLNNGSFVICSPDWKNGSLASAGAATWCSGTAAVSGAISAANSLVGTSTGDQVSAYGITELPNGFYLLRSGYWKNGANTNSGAITRLSNTAISTGSISAANSLVGTNANDYVGSGSITILANGNYVICSPNWTNGSTDYAGAATWVNGSNGLTGTISAANSLVGSQSNDRVGSDGCIALYNGNYVVASSSWQSDASANAGAATWGSGTIGVKGVVSAANSLVGTNMEDYIGTSVVALTNGNYVVRSNNYVNSAFSNPGAVTWCNGSTGKVGTVNQANSLVGSSDDANVGSGIVALPNGNYVVGSQQWGNGVTANLGAVTFGRGNGGVSGTISVANSLVGTTENDGLGSYYTMTVVNNGIVVLKTESYNNGASLYAGAITVMNADAGMTGTINGCNSVLGGVMYGGSNLKSVYNATNNYLLISAANENKLTIYTPFSQGLAQNSDQASASVSSGSSTAAPLIDYNTCHMIASVKSSGATPVNGVVNAKAYLRSSAQIFNGQALVRRTYDITPAANANTATGAITLYYEQSDFNDYNANRGSSPMLPTGPSDYTGIANLKINQQHGTSPSGIPATYTGWTGNGPGNVMIDPNDANVIWNSSMSRWEVTFDVTGFSGFFAFSGSGVLLPLKWLEVDGSIQTSNKALVNWKVQEQHVSSYTVERSMDGVHFVAVNTVASTGDGTNTYQIADPLAFMTGNQVAYHRIQQTDVSGNSSYSKIVALSLMKQGSIVSVYPVPFHSSFTITSSAKESCTVTDNTGRIIMMLQLTNGSNTVQSEPWVAGTYYLKTNTGQTVKLIKE